MALEARASRLTAGAALLAVLAAGQVGAGAQVNLPTVPGVGPTTTTTTTSPPPTTAPPTSQSPAGTPPPSGPEPGPAPAQPQGGAPPPGPPPAPGADRGDGPQPPPDAPKAVPPDAQARMNAVRRTGPNSTRKLLEALRPLRSLGLSEQEAIQAGFGRFPVGGYATYSHDWLYPRFTPTFHLHEGTDVFAAFGTPVRSPADGVLRHSSGAVGGLSAYVHEPNGTYYYLAHLQGFVAGQSSGRRVKAGEVIGYNGDSGNAKGGAPHVHFEVHPRGGGPVDPKSYLDGWLAEALADVPRLIESLESGRPRAVIATGLTRRLADGGGGAFAAPVAPPRHQLLWASSASPAGGPLRLAEAEAAVAARQVDWSALARRQQAEVDAQRSAEARAR